MKLSYRDLLGRLTDLERLATPPLPGERGGCMSSTDRRSRYDPETDRYIDWDANDDGGGVIREEEDGFVVAFEQDGPGVIWRVWSAMPESGAIQIFIDGARRPVVDVPFAEFFGRFDGMPMGFPSLAPVLSRGRNRWIPIPYNRSAKVRLGRGWGAYYHFTYTKFPDGTQLPVFDGSLSREDKIALATVDRALTDRGWNVLPRSEGDTLERFSVTVEPGATTTVKSILGNRAITGMRIVPLDLPASPAGAAAQALTDLTLQITWDADASPSVWAPLGDFFSSTPGLQTVRTLPHGATEGGGLYSHWFMPFSQRALLAVGNDGSEARTLWFTIAHRPLAAGEGDRLLRFHAKWHRDFLLERSQVKGRDIDWPLLLADEGPGRFCGVQMHVYNKWEDPPPPERGGRDNVDWWYGVGWDKSIDWWWGEGDEKFFVDGEKFPSSFGTGSEDYVGYAWAAEPPFPTFGHAFAAQPYVELNANGHTSVCRLHVADDVPWHKSFEGCIEKYKGNRWGDKGENFCRYAVVVYWYQAAGQTDLYGPWPVEKRDLETSE